MCNTYYCTILACTGVESRTYVHKRGTAMSVLYVVQGISKYGIVRTVVYVHCNVPVVDDSIGGNSITVARIVDHHDGPPLFL
jgi:hypothetical protein